MQTKLKVQLEDSDSLLQLKDSRISDISKLNKELLEKMTCIKLENVRKYCCLCDLIGIDQEFYKTP